METVNFGGDNPQPRFGHTICLISPGKIVLFGGAVGDTGKYNITGDIFVGDLSTRKWKKVEANGNVPSQRAAHCALQIELNQMIIFGGAVGGSNLNQLQGGGLADDNLYVFDIRNGEDHANWIIVPVIGTTPGRRYGHTMVLIKPHLIIYGGNTGTEPVNDVWSLNLDKSPYSWNKLECASESPCVRVYHSAALCSTGSANGMMVIFGGRTADQSALNDTWGLRRHRDGRWDWVRAPYKNPADYPSQRYQHSTIFLGTLMLVIGGRSNQVGETLPFEIYDTETSDWFKFPAIQRFRHSSWITEQFLFLHGGFDSDTPNIPTEGILKMDLAKRLQQSPQLLKQLTITLGNINLNASFARNTNTIPNTNVQPPRTTGTNNQMESEYRRTVGQQPPNNRNLSNKKQILQDSAGGQNRITSANQKNIRLANQAVVALTYGPEEDASSMVKKVSIEKLQEEHKKLLVGFQDPNYNSKSAYLENICQPFLNNLLLPKDYQGIPANSNMLQGIKKDMILKLCEETLKVLERESLVLRLRAPIKIFGSLNGQYIDLMRYFDHFKAPYDNLYNGDIDSYEYLFLGGYVDRGTRSVETILLLFALKLRYPDQIHLLRGHHEDKKINKMFGFADECFLKFQEDIMDPNSVYQRVNKVFEYMPLAALVEEKILCMHGGIGVTIRTIDEIELIQRPVEISHDPKTYQQKIALELLWSEPVQNDEDTENSMNTERDLFNTKQMMRFGTNRSNKFMQENNLNMIVRSHEPVAEGFERAANNIITIFSASDYAGNQGNQGGMLTIRKNNQIIPKLINPTTIINGEQRWMDLEEAPQRKKNYSKYVLIDNEEINHRKRAPTPIRKKKILKK